MKPKHYGWRCQHVHYSGTRCHRRYSNSEQRVCVIHRDQDTQGDDRCTECYAGKSAFGLT